MTTATKFWTWAEIKAKMESELDLAEETFIDADELLGYANDAIESAESQIHSIYEDYFLTQGQITLVKDQDTYSLPTDIYAQKIRGIIYFNGTRVYEVKRIRDWKKFMVYRMARTFQTKTEDYWYFLTNGTAGLPKIILTPPSYENGQLAEIWYLRNANRLAADGDVCDIPQFVSFVFKFITERVFFKYQAGSPKHLKAAEDLEAVTEDMVSTLTQMVADGDNEIEPDLSSYREHN